MASDHQPVLSLSKGPPACPELVEGPNTYFCLITACAAASLAIGTRKGEQLT